MSRLLGEARLLPFPGQPAPPVEITVAVGRLGDGGLALRYRLVGDLAGIVWPEPATPERVDGLWQSTCFEAFVMAGEGPAYQEHNFAPSGAWAAYRFDQYRTGWRWNPDGRDPAIFVERAARGGADLHATIAAPGGDALRLGLTAILATSAGERSYWALAHPAAQPDFHDAACFALRLPPVEIA